MKKLFLLPLLFLAFMFTGCQEPDDDVDMPVPEKSVEELIQGSWYNDLTSTRYYDYAPADSLGSLLKESKRLLDPQSYEGYFEFDGNEMRQSYNVYWGISDFFIVDSVGNTYIKIYDYHDTAEQGVARVYEIMAISDKAMTWQEVIRTDKLEGQNKWKKTVITYEFTNLYKD